MSTIKANEITRTTLEDHHTRYIAKTEKLMVIVNDFTGGANTKPDPLHSHPHEQISYVASGEIEVFIGDETTHLATGDLFTVPPNIPHTIRLLTDTARLVDTFHPIREDLL